MHARRPTLAPRLRGPAARCRSRRACATSPLRDGLAPLLVRDEAGALEHVAEVVERERRAGVESRAGHQSRGYHGCGPGRAIGAAARWPLDGRASAGGAARRRVPARYAGGPACRRPPSTASSASCSSSATHPRMALDAAAADLVAECVLRSGAELSAKVRKGEPELVEEAGTRSAGLRVIKGKRVASTSTSDLTDAGIERFVGRRHRARGASRRRTPSPARPTRSSSAIPTRARPRPLRPRGRRGRRRAGHRARQGGRGGGLRVRPAHHQQRGRHVRAHGRRRRRSCCRAASAPPTRARTSRSASCPSRPTRAARTAAATTGPRAGTSPSSIRRPRSGARPRGARCASSARARVPTCEVPGRVRPGRRALHPRACSRAASWAAPSGASRATSSGREGTRVASDLVTVVDDPLIPRAPGSRAVRRRGPREPRRTSSSRRASSARTSATATRRASSGARARRARRAAAAPGWARARRTSSCSPGPTRTRPSSRARQRGLYVTEMMGFGFNAVTGDFSRGAAASGSRTASSRIPVSEVTISLNVDELWQRIDAVGSDLDLRTSTASPTLRVAQDDGRRRRLRERVDDRRGREGAPQGARVHGQGARRPRSGSIRPRCSRGRRPSSSRPRRTSTR